MNIKYVGKKCPYCKTNLNENDEIVICNKCEMPHHKSCWEANGACTTFGCDGDIREIINAREASNSIESDKTIETLSQVAVNSGSKAKYETVFEAQRSKLQLEVPIIIERVSILKDSDSQELFARIGFRCLSDRAVKAIMVNISAKDVWGNVTDGVDGAQFLDLKAKKNSEFGQNQPVKLPDKNTRSVEVLISKILYEDGEMVDCGNRCNYIPTPVLLRDYFGKQEYADQYSSEVGIKAKYVPVMGEAVWRCACGTINKSNNTICEVCSSVYENLLSKLNKETIINDYDKAVEEKRLEDERIQKAREQEQKEAEQRLRAAQEAKEKEEKEKKEAKKQRIKKILIRTIAVIIAIPLLAGSVYGIGWHLIPYIRYNIAASNVNNHQYDAAYNTYIALGDYKDCKDKATETIYAKGEYLISTEEYKQAAVEFNRILQYKDSKSKADYCTKQATYVESKKKYEEGQYAEAANGFSSITGYLDSDEWLKKSKYAKANEYFENKQFEDAEKLYKELGNYEDSSDKEIESKYLMAEDYYNQKKYKEAYLAFSELPTNYKDSVQKTQISAYEYAEVCMSEKKYVEAIDAYYKAKEYKDGQDKYTEAKYLYAKECMDKKDYSEAAYQLASIKEYKDAEDIWKEAKYLGAKDDVAKRDYSSAVTAFKTISGYKDSSSLMDDAMYKYITSHKNSTDRKTYDYLKDLKSKGYKDTNTIYSGLYKWSLTFTAVNTSQNGSTNMSSISKYDPVYFHYKISGGPPGGSTVITFKYTDPEGRGGSYKSKNNDYSGSTGWYGWEDGIYTNPWYGAAGTLTVSAYDSNGNKIGSTSVRITH